MIDIVNRDFRGNEATPTNDGGGGAALLGGTYTIVNTLFSGNYAGTIGGALLLGGASRPADVTLINCTLAGNNASGNGGGVFVANGDGDRIVRNGVPWDSTKGTDPPEPSQIVFAGAEVYDTIIEGGWGGTGSGVLDDDPEFVNAKGAPDHARLPAS